MLSIDHCYLGMSMGRVRHLTGTPQKLVATVFVATTALHVSIDKYSALLLVYHLSLPRVIDGWSVALCLFQLAFASDLLAIGLLCK